MIIRALDTGGDWLFGKGTNDYVSAKKALAQLIRTRLLSFLNDCFFDVAGGIDWFNLLGAKNQEAINIAVSTVILNTFGITALTRLSSILDENRNLTIVYSCTSIFPGFIEESVGLLLDEMGNFLITESGDTIHA